VRDLGGLPTEDGSVTVRGRVMRADDIGLAGPEAWQAAAGDGVRRVVDLRFPDERERRGSPTTLDVVHVSVLGDRDPVYWDMLHAERDRVGDAGYHAFSYRSFLDRHADRFADAVTAVASTPEGAVAFHCVAGKDRTGIVAGLLLRLAGVSLDAVDADYALSGDRLRAAGYVAIDYRGVRQAPLSPAGVMRDVLVWLEGRHGSVAEYLASSGCADETLGRARSMLREP
jgi:hypothetical protein